MPAGSHHTGHAVKAQPFALPTGDVAVPVGEHHTGVKVEVKPLSLPAGDIIVPTGLQRTGASIKTKPLALPTGDVVVPVGQLDTVLEIILLPVFFHPTVLLRFKFCHLKRQGDFLLDVVIRQCSSVLQNYTGKH